MRGGAPPLLAGAVSHVAVRAGGRPSRAGRAVNGRGGNGNGGTDRRLVRAAGAVDAGALGGGGFGGVAGGRRAAVVGRHRLRRRPAPRRRHFAAGRAPEPPPGQGGLPAAESLRPEGGPAGDRPGCVREEGPRGTAGGPAGCSGRACAWASRQTGWEFW